MQNGIRLSSTSSVMAGLTIDQFDVGVLAFFFLFNRNLMHKDPFYQHSLGQEKLTLARQGRQNLKRVLILQSMKLQICEGSCFFSSIRTKKSKLIFVNK